MKILSRYLGRQIMLGVTATALILTAIMMFIVFVGELDDIGQGAYGLANALVYSGIYVLVQTYQLFPMICLVGALFALLQLAMQSEIAVMRASTLSKWMILRIVLQTALVIVLCVTAFGEFALPRLNQYAQTYKMRLKSNGKILRTANGAWLRDGNAFIRISQIHSADLLTGIQIYQLDNQQQIKAITFANKAQQEDGQWYLYQVAESRLGKSKIAAHTSPKVIWQAPVNSQYLNLARLLPEDMTLSELWHFITLKVATKTDTRRDRYVFWSRLSMPLACLVMLLLALPFVFGSARQMTMGANLTLGIIAGFCFYILNRFLGPASMVYAVPPLLAALLPTLLFALIGIIVFVRTR